MRASRLSSLRLGLLSFALVLGGCSALINPDGARLGGGDDAGVTLMDGGPAADAGPGVDGGPRADAGPPGRDGGPPPLVDGGCTAPDRCEGGELVTCEGTTPCSLGCAPGGEARCAQMVPSNVSEDLLDPSARSVDIAAGDPLLFDTTACSAMSADSTIVSQSGGGPELCVLTVDDFTIRTGAALGVFGSRPLVILASGDVTIERDARLDVSARGPEPGAGGGRGGTPQDEDGEGDAAGRAGENRDTYDDGGGGGGAFCGDGGDGGDGDSAAGGAGGGARSAELLIPLRGGSGGGLGEGGRSTFRPDNTANTGLGGAGGGAVQISALGTVRIDGLVLAGGGGGGGGGVDGRFGNWGAGGGGGSGGGILIEAPAIAIGSDARVTTSGGGGGGGASSSSAGGEGADGRLTLGPADGGATGGSTYGAPGGDSGGGGTAEGLAGGSNGAGGANGGGGGGGVGCVVYRTTDGAAPAGASDRTSGSGAPSLSTAPLLRR